MSEQEAALGIAQIAIASLLKTTGYELTPEIIRERAKSIASVLGGPIDIEKLVAELTESYKVFIVPASKLVDDSPHVPWLSQVDRTGWRYWPRYRKLLVQTLPQAIIDQTDDDTDTILGLLGNPGSAAPWDRRGLVVGEVQSGKTTNYTALVCKAADAGYRVVIVLAGIHESLRMQTQIRMDEGFLGRNTDLSGAVVGVGAIDPTPRPVSATTRSLRGDFNRTIAKQLDMPLDSGPPILLVVKKNAKTLQNLLNFLKRTDGDVAARSIRHVPALIVDDESDNASVDTRGQSYDSDDVPDPTFEPTAINGLIRQILRVFEQKSYVGYTATPFANVFIHHKGMTDKADNDLFPQNFIVNLHPPSNYFGASQAFGLERGGAAGDYGAPLVRVIDGTRDDARELEGWMPARHKQSHAPVIGNADRFPASLRRALLSFFISCGVRKLRGQVVAHNSMLVHVTRFTRLQEVIHDDLAVAVDKIRLALRFEADGPGSIWAEFRQVWESDFVPTSARLRGEGLPGGATLPDWSVVSGTLRDIVAKVRIKKINGLAQDVLDYENFKNEGIDVIAVGGNKLSRGLTLEGLTVSYFARQTDMYDTLLQMGRWFGYRPGYLDLCRLYTTTVLRQAFEHIAIASDELRTQFDFMQDLGIRPVDFGLKVLGHTKLKATAAGKRRHAEDVVIYETYAGKVTETKSFGLDTGTLSRNREALDRLIRTVSIAGEASSPRYPTESRERSYEAAALWRDVGSDTITEFLRAYETEPTARLANSRLWMNYIKEQQADTGELLLWNVAVFKGDRGDSQRIGGLDLRRTLRKRDTADTQTNYGIRRLVTNRDVGVDLSKSAWDTARSYDPKDRSGATPKQEPTSQANCWARMELGINPLLMVYLPEPEIELPTTDPVVGVAIAFPGSRSASRTPIRYTVNSVFLEQLEREGFDDE